VVACATAEYVSWSVREDLFGTDSAKRIVGAFLIASGHDQKPENHCWWGGDSYSFKGQSEYKKEEMEPHYIHNKPFSLINLVTVIIQSSTSKADAPIFPSPLRLHRL